MARDVAPRKWNVTNPNPNNPNPNPEYDMVDVDDEDGYCDYEPDTNRDIPAGHENAGQPRKRERMQVSVVRSPAASKTSAKPQLDLQAQGGAHGQEAEMGVHETLKPQSEVSSSTTRASNSIAIGAELPVPSPQSRSMRQEARGQHEVFDHNFQPTANAIPATLGAEQIPRRAGDGQGEDKPTEEADDKEDFQDRLEEIELRREEIELRREEMELRRKKRAHLKRKQGSA